MEFCMSEDTLRRGYMVSQKELHVSERAELRNTLLDQTWLPEEQNQILQVSSWNVTLYIFWPNDVKILGQSPVKDNIVHQTVSCLWLWEGILCQMEGEPVAIFYTWRYCVSYLKILIHLVGQSFPYASRPASLHTMQENHSKCFRSFVWRGDH